MNIVLFFGSLFLVASHFTAFVLPRGKDEFGLVVFAAYGILIGPLVHGILSLESQKVNAIITIIFHVFGTLLILIYAFMHKVMNL